MSQELITKINEVVKDYFKQNKDVDWIPAKKLMPELIAAGVFPKDEKKGLPLRKVFRALDKDNNLDSVPLLHAERAGVDTYWYLVREGAEYGTNDTDAPVSKKKQGILNFESSDKFYVLNLCDKIVKQDSSRQHRFTFLKGDLHKDGVTRTPLPVDAFYQKSSLVIEFFESQISSELEEESTKKTISGVTRAEQRELYLQRKRDLFKEKGISFVELNFSMFECDKYQKLLRKKINDSKAIRAALKGII